MEKIHYQIEFRKLSKFPVDRNTKPNRMTNLSKQSKLISKLRKKSQALIGCTPQHQAIGIRQICQRVHESLKTKLRSIRPTQRKKNLKQINRPTLRNLFTEEVRQQI